MTGCTPGEAKSPFDDKTADIILRSSDSIHFYVNQFVLSLASPIFRDMFELGKPVDPDVSPPLALADSCSRPSSRHQIIDVSEPSSTLDLLLRFCYPVEEPKISQVSDVANVLRTASKYEMSGVIDRLSHCLRDPKYASDPRQLYSVACRYGMREVAAIAAKASLRSYMPSFESCTTRSGSVPASAYNNLLAYRKQCERLFDTQLESVQYTLRSNIPSCGRCPSTRVFGCPTYPWFSAFVDRMKSAYLDRVAADSVQSPTLLAECLRDLPPLWPSALWYDAPGPRCSCAIATPPFLLLFSATLAKQLDTSLEWV